MKLRPEKAYTGKTCAIPRRHEAIEALLALTWRKSKQDRPTWLIQEVSSHC